MGRWGQLLADIAGDPAPADASARRARAVEGAEGSGPDATPVPGDVAARAVVRCQRRAERAEAELADLRRDAARTVLELRREVAYWRLRAEGLPEDRASSQARDGWPVIDTVWEG